MTTIDPTNASEPQLRDYDHLSDMNPYVGLDSSQKSRFIEKKSWLEKVVDLFN